MGFQTEAKMGSETGPLKNRVLEDFMLKINHFWGLVLEGILIFCNIFREPFFSIFRKPKNRIWEPKNAGLTQGSAAEAGAVGR